MLTSEDGEPLPSAEWFKKYFKLSDPNQEVSTVKSFGFYVGLLNGKNAVELSKDFDFFRALLNLYDLEDVCAKRVKMPVKSHLAPFCENSSTNLPGVFSRGFITTANFSTREMH